MTRHVLAAVGLGAVLAAAAPATAAENCVGEDSIVYVCVTTPEPYVAWTTYCVYAGGSECRDVDVPVPDYTGDAAANCGGIVTRLSNWPHDVC